MLILLLSPCILSIFHKFFNLFLVTGFYLVHGLIMSIYNIIIIILHFGNSVSVVLVGFVFILFVIRFPFLECVLVLLMSLLSDIGMVVVHTLFVLNVKSFFFLGGESQSCQFILVFTLCRLQLLSMTILQALQLLRMAFHNLVDVCSISGFFLFSVRSGSLQFIQLLISQVLDLLLVQRVFHTHSNLMIQLLLGMDFKNLFFLKGRLILEVNEVLSVVSEVLVVFVGVLLVFIQVFVRD